MVGWKKLHHDECNTTWSTLVKDSHIHKDVIFEDILKWQPQDIVIIEESVRVRCYTPYLKMSEDLRRITDNLIHEDIVPITRIRYKKTKRKSDIRSVTPQRNR